FQASLQSKVELQCKRPSVWSSAQLNPSCLSSSSNVDDLSHLAEADRVLWPRIRALIEGSVVWDGVYFVRIAECGYEYEQTYAFLPLLPLSISLLSRFVFAPLIPVIGYRAVLVLSGYVLNNIAFILAAIYFYKLSLLILKDSTTSLQASVLFCFNPASIFYSSIYSESLYALFSIWGIFYLFSGSNAMAMLLLAVSGAARSNGAINAGYFCFKALLQTYDAITYKRSIRLGLQAIVNGAVCSVCLLVPFAAFQAYGYYNICFHGASDGLRPWCSSRVPNLYGYLQSHYWGVGFLKYFEVKQLPNFLLASPILTISIASVIYYASLLQQSLHSFRITSDPHGKDHSGELISSDNSSTSLEFKETGNHDLRRRKSGNKPMSSKNSHFVELEIDSFIKFKKGYCSLLIFPFILHLGFMSFMALFVMHVQVATRFLSASPPIYWFASYLLLSPGTTSRRIGYLIWSYSIAYILLGSLLFSNFYPFT
ncbi:GPI mannosyltransferase 2, partial [Phalaenopsis equestris]|uniref:GPI mannosyltransferase 2 n=1 Tax=Phalaenopsis equestris TaxID=78828 RepID=UPI0009E22203